MDEFVFKFSDFERKLLAKPPLKMDKNRQEMYGIILTDGLLCVTNGHAIFYRRELINIQGHFLIPFGHVDATIRTDPSDPSAILLDMEKYSLQVKPSRVPRARLILEGDVWDPIPEDQSMPQRSYNYEAIGKAYAALRKGSKEGLKTIHTKSACRIENDEWGFLIMPLNL